MTEWRSARVILAWVALALAIGVPVALAAASEQLSAMRERISGALSACVESRSTALSTVAEAADEDVDSTVPAALPPEGANATPYAVDAGDISEWQSEGDEVVMRF